MTRIRLHSLVLIVLFLSLSCVAVVQAVGWVERSDAPCSGGYGEAVVRDPSQIEVQQQEQEQYRQQQQEEQWEEQYQQQEDYYVHQYWERRYWRRHFLIGSFIGFILLGRLLLSIIAR